MFTTKQNPTQERKPMSDEDYRRYKIRLKSNAKKNWKKDILTKHKSVKDYEKTLVPINLEVLKSQYKPNYNG